MARRQKKEIYAIDVINEFRNPTEMERDRIVPWFEYHIKENWGSKFISVLCIVIGLPLIFNIFEYMKFIQTNFMYWLATTLFFLLIGGVFLYAGIGMWLYKEKHKKILTAIKNGDFSICEMYINHFLDKEEDSSISCNVRTLSGSVYDEKFRVVADKVREGSRAYLVYCPLARELNINSFIEVVLTDFMLSSDGLYKRITIRNTYVSPLP